MVKNCQCLSNVTFSKDCLNIKINHGATPHYDKAHNGMKINDGKAWLTMLILGFIIFILGFLYLEFIILIPWV